MSKNWVGNKKSIFVTLGASNHVTEDREENDYYATDPIVVNQLLEVEKFNNNIYECAVGGGHIASVLYDLGYNVVTSDIIDRGYRGTIIRDFLTYEFSSNFKGDIITNPPYKYAKEFVEKSLSIINEGNRVAMFLKLSFLEGQKRGIMFKKYPPKYVYVFSKRAKCGKNGKFESYNEKKKKIVKYFSATAYAWFIWEKGSTSETIVRWI